jgi:hypothetical protein
MCVCVYVSLSLSLSLSVIVSPFHHDFLSNVQNCSYCKFQLLHSRSISCGFCSCSDDEVEFLYSKLFWLSLTSARPFSLHSEIRQDLNGFFHLFLAFFCFDSALQFTSLTIWTIHQIISSLITFEDSMMKMKKGNFWIFHKILSCPSQNFVLWKKKKKYFLNFTLEKHSSPNLFSQLHWTYTSTWLTPKGCSNQILNSNFGQLL